MAVQRKASSLEPEMAKDLMRAYRIIRESLSDGQLARLIASGNIDKILDDALLDRSLRPLRDRIKTAVEKGFNGATKELPKGGKVNGQMAVAFDTLNPKVIDGIRTLDSRVIQGLTTEMRDTVKAYVENGLRDGRPPASIARDLRAVLGMSPTQVENAMKYEAKLRALVRKPLTDAQIETKVAAYQRKAIAQNARVVSRTATLDSLKLGQRLTWDEAISKGIADPTTLWMRWVSVGDDRVRPEHVAMNGEEVPYNSTYSNGDTVPGSGTFNCRCLSVYFVKRAA